MHPRSALAFVLAAIVTTSSGPGEIAVAQDPIADAACESAKDALIGETVKAILKARGIPEWAINAGDGTYGASKEYLTNKDENRLRLATLSAIKSALSAVAPASAPLVNGPDLMIASVEATIGEAQALRARAFLCNGFSYGAAQGLPSFFAYPYVQQVAPGVNCGNFAARVTTYQQLQALKDYWEGYYSRQVKERAGDDLATRDTLGQAWFTLEQGWAAKWAETEYARIRQELQQGLDGGAGVPPRCSAPGGIQARPQQASYTLPRMPSGNFVDRCYAFASGCDDNAQNDPRFKPSADAFCKSKGHLGVVPGGSNWSFRAPTENQSGGSTCTDASGCGSLDWVVCQ